MNTSTSMIFNVLIKKEGGLFLAHCLELDLVATAKTFSQVKKEMKDIIETQVDYAFSNDNLDHLYRPAPAEVWREFYSCQEMQEEKLDIRSSFKKTNRERFIPPWIIARMCEVSERCRV